MTEYVSPSLTLQEIVTTLHDWNIDVSEVDFRRPDPRRWRDIYAMIYEILSGRSIESAVQTMIRDMKLNGNVSNPEAYEEAVSQIAFTQCLQRVLAGCGFNSFSLKDIIQPSAKGVRRISSVFVNRTRHDERVSDVFKEVQERAQKSRGEYESVIRKNQELKQRLSADEENEVHRKAELQKVECECEDAQKAIMELMVTVDEEKRAIQDHKLKISEIDAEKAKLKILCEQKGQECGKLSRKIVQSPKKFQVDLDRLKRKVGDMKSQLHKEEQILSESRLLVEQTKNKIDAAAKAKKLAIEVLADFDKDVELQSEMNSLAEKEADLQEALTSCAPQEEDLSERFHMRQAQKHTLTSQNDMRQQCGRDRRADRRQYADKLKENIKAVETQKSSVKDEMSQAKLKISEVLDGREAEAEEFKREEARLVQMINAQEQISEQALAKFKTFFCED